MRKTGMYAIMTAAVIGLFAGSPVPAYAAFGFSDCGQMPGTLSALFNSGQNQSCPTLPTGGCPTTNALPNGSLAVRHPDRRQLSHGHCHPRRQLPDSGAVRPDSRLLGLSHTKCPRLSAASRCHLPGRYASDAG